MNVCVALAMLFANKVRNGELVVTSGGMGEAGLSGSFLQPTITAMAMTVVRIVALVFIRDGVLVVALVISSGYTNKTYEMAKGCLIPFVYDRDPDPFVEFHHDQAA